MTPNSVRNTVMNKRVKSFDQIEIANIWNSTEGARPISRQLYIGLCQTYRIVCTIVFREYTLTLF